MSVYRFQGDFKIIIIVNFDWLDRWPYRCRKWSWEVGRRDRAFCPRQEDTGCWGSSWVQTTPRRTGDPTYSVTTSPEDSNLWTICVLSSSLFYSSLCSQHSILLVLLFLSSVFLKIVYWFFRQWYCLPDWIFCVREGRLLFVTVLTFLRKAIINFAEMTSTNSPPHCSWVSHWIFLKCSMCKSPSISQPMRPRLPFTERWRTNLQIDAFTSLSEYINLDQTHVY